MDSEQLSQHPIFSLPKSLNPSSQDESFLELSTSSLSKFLQNNEDSEKDVHPSGRRRIMVLRDTDLIVAAGQELRMASLGDVKAQKGSNKSFKVPFLSRLRQRMNTDVLFRLYTPQTYSSRYVKSASTRMENFWRLLVPIKLRL